MSRTWPKLSSLLIAAAYALAAPLLAQQDSSRITIEQIFDKGEFWGDFFGTARWTRDGSSYMSWRRAPDRKGLDLVQTDAVTGAQTVVVPAARFVPAGDSLPVPVESYSFSPDGTKLLLFANSARVWRANTRGDFWVLDIPSGKLSKLGGKEAQPSTLMFAKFSPQGDRVAYVRKNNLYVERLSDGKITQLTKDGSVTIINGTFDWVYEEEFFLRDGFRWSPDGKRVAYWQLDASGVKDFLLINDTDSLYPYTIPVQYPKAGTTNSAARIGVVGAGGGKTKWLETPGDPRNTYLARMDWSGNSDEVWVEHLNRQQNTVTFLLGDAKSGKVRTVFTERDSAWVDVSEVRWLGASSFTWVSERNGWRHIYLISRDGQEVKDLTPGEYDVASVEATDTTGGFVYYIASPDNPTQRYLFRARLDGTGNAERLSPANEPGTHDYQIAPGMRFAIHTYERFDTPGVTDVVRLPGHESVRVVVSNEKLKERLAKLKRGPVSFFRVDAGNGVSLDGYIMRPVDYDSTKKYPVLFYVYGEPASQTATDSWNGDYPWNLMLTQLGYTVITMDNRGTPSLRGSAWRKSVYRKIGVLSSEDQAGAARTIGQWAGIDSSRYAVWGWSGGASTTLNLMFRYPDIYKVGMAVAPVPDMHLYDTIYQERYMGLPQENEEDYKQGSPITFAAQLKGRLLLVHGSGDDNVHYQGTERLVNALVAAGRPFSMMVYPNRTHGIFEGEGTTVHVYSLLARYLTENLPAGPR